MTTMTLARSFERILRRQFHMHAAWIPAVTRISLGDYGLWRGGVFVPIGNVREFGVTLDVIEGGAASLDFVSEDARVTTFAAGARVPALPDDETEAQLVLELPSAESFILKCPTVRSRRIGNLAAVVRALHQSYRRGGAERWRLRYKVVGELLTADDLTLLATSVRGTRVTFHGKARLLRQFTRATVDASLTHAADHQLALELRRASGAVGLGLFRVNVRGLAALDFGAATPGVCDVDDESLAELVPEDDWNDEPADDPEA